MDILAHWHLIANPTKPDLPLDIARDEQHANLMHEHDWVIIGVVPVEQLQEIVEAFAQERQDVLNCINLYGDEVLHKALDSIGWPDDYIKEQ